MNYLHMTRTLCKVFQKHPRLHALVARFPRIHSLVARLCARNFQRQFTSLERQKKVFFKNIDHLKPLSKKQRAEFLRLGRKTRELVLKAHALGIPPKFFLKQL